MFPSQKELENITSFVKTYLPNDLHWNPKSSVIFVAPVMIDGAPVRPFSVPGLGFSYSQPFELSLKNPINPVLVEYCEQLVNPKRLYPNAPHTKEAWCNEVGIAAAAAYQGMSFDVYLNSHPDSFKHPNGGTVNQMPFNVTEYELFLDMPQ